MSLAMVEVEACYRDGGDWCTLEKAQSLAALVLARRPRVVCEVGVWMGGSLVPMAIAQRCLLESGLARSSSCVIAVDSWSAAASTVGQAGDDASWWASVDHDQAHRVFVERLHRHRLDGVVQIVRQASDDAPVPPQVDLLHIDGNHAEQAVRDVRRFGAAVPLGGVLVLDDLNWRGGHVARARDVAVSLGFQPEYALGTGEVMVRVAAPAAGGGA